MALENIGEKKIIIYINEGIKEKFAEIEHGKVDEDDDNNKEKPTVGESEEEEEEQQQVKNRMISSFENVVVPGDIIARIIDRSDSRFSDSKYNARKIRTDFATRDTRNVMFDAKTGEFVSVIYGFARLMNGIEFIVDPLTEYSSDKMKAWIYISRSLSNKWPDLKNIKSIYEIENIMFPLEDNQIRPVLERVIEIGKSGEKILIAEGTPPKNGRPEMIALKKDTKLKIGKMDDKGRIDYKEKDSFIIVNAGEVIAEVLPQIPPEDGIDVFGNPITAKIKGENPYRLGQNVTRDADNNKDVVTEVDGVLEIDDDGKIHVENTLVIGGNVNLETGNIHFPGMVQVKGSVEPGFLVEADGNVLVNNNVDDARIVSGGNVIVQNGIMGKEKARVTAKGTIKCKFTQNAELKSGKEIHISDAAVQTKAFAIEAINVEGSVLGGEMIARHRLIVNNAGSASGVKTHLTAGRDPEIEEKIDALSHENSELSKRLKEIIDELTSYFGEDFIKNIKSIIHTLPKHRKVTALKLVKEMSELNGKITKIRADKEKLKSMFVFDTPPFIQITNEVFPEVYIRIKNCIKKIEKKITTPTFKEDPYKKIIYWES